MKDRGILNQENIIKLAEKENVKPHTLWMDWSRRNLWLEEMAQVEQTRSMIIEMLHEFSAVREESWKTYTEAKSKNCLNAAVGALHMVTKALLKEMEFRQSLGIMEKMPEEMIIRGELVRKQMKAVVVYLSKEKPELAENLIGALKSLPERIDVE